MRKVWSIAAAVVLAAGTLSACTGQSGTQPESANTSEAGSSAEGESAAGSEAAPDLEKIVVGATPAPHAEILEAAKPLMAEKGYDLVIKEYTDYIQPNVALDSKDLDANYFQHINYLESFNAERGTNLVSAGDIHYEPFGIYAGKTASLEELKDGAAVAVPNDTTNEARALMLLQDQGLITLNEGADINATKKDIEVNERNLDIKEVEAAQIPRSIMDVDLAIINGNYAIEAGLNISDALAMESGDSLAIQNYKNVVAVVQGRENDPAIQALVEVLTSDAIKEYMNENYDGAVVPMEE